MSSVPSVTNSYIGSIDGLRAMAVLAVLAYHSETVLSSGPAGVGGVDIFFVVSGFVITRSLAPEILRDRAINYRRFYARRAVRLMPALLAVVLVSSTVWWALLGADAKFWVEAAVAVLYLTPFYLLFNGSAEIFNHTWTLGVEEYFYIVLPAGLVAMAGWRWSRRLQIAVLLGCALMPLGFLAIARILTEEPSLFLNYFLRAGGLFLGCAAAVVCERRPQTLKNPQVWAMFGMLFILIGMALLGRPRIGGFAFLTIDIATAALLLALAQERRGAVSRALSVWPLRYLGKISYEIYLWHLPAILLVGEIWGGDDVSVAVSAYLATFLLASVTHRLFEPLQRAARSGIDRRWNGVSSRSAKEDAR